MATQGRPKKPTELKKRNYTVTLVPKEATALEETYGSLTLAIRNNIISSKPNFIGILNQIEQLLTELKQLSK